MNTTTEQKVLSFDSHLQEILINPRPFLNELLNKNVIVRLKWKIEYKGKLASFDKYMNIQLLNTEEIIDGHSTGTLGEVLIRCNNILFVKECTD